MFATEVKPVRLFLALWPDAAVRARLVNIMGNLKRDMSGAWVKPDNLHMTLAFLGDIAPERSAEIHRVAGEVTGLGFTLSLDHVEFWSRNGIICLAPPATPPELQALAGDLARSLNAAGFTLETRPYRAHLTLARKGRATINRVALAEPVVWKVDALHLVESQLGQNGARYRCLRSWPLPVAKATPEKFSVG